MAISRAIPIVSAACLSFLMAGCADGPTGPIASDLGLPPVEAAVRAPTTALPFWARGPLCCIDDHVVIYFYVVDPADVPADFNLLDFFDFRALGATLAVEGFNIRESATDPVPRKTTLHGIAPVPFWFIPSAIFDEAVADGFVGVQELDRPELVVGFADKFVEELHPSGGTAQQAHLSTSARGDLVGGGRFRFALAVHETSNGEPINFLLNGSLIFD